MNKFKDMIHWNQKLITPRDGTNVKKEEKKVISYLLENYKYVVRSHVVRAYCY